MTETMFANCVPDQHIQYTAKYTNEMWVEIGDVPLGKQKHGWEEGDSLYIGKVATLGHRDVPLILIAAIMVIYL